MKADTKPDLTERLTALLDTLQHQAPAPGAPAGTAPGQDAKPADRLAVKLDGRVIFLRPTEIDWIEAAGNYVRLHLGQESHLFRETMNRMESRLDRRRFARIHRSRIVNTERIKELQPWFNGDHVVILRDGTRLTLSRGYKEKLQQRLGKGL